MLKHFSDSAVVQALNSVLESMTHTHAQCTIVYVPVPMTHTHTCPMYYCVCTSLCVFLIFILGLVTRLRRPPLQLVPNQPVLSSVFGK